MDKSKTAADESYRDLSNLERKLQKHEAFERELRANEGQLRNVNKVNFLSETSYMIFFNFGFFYTFLDWSIFNIAK